MPEPHVCRTSLAGCSQVDQWVGFAAQSVASRDAGIGTTPAGSTRAEVRAAQRRASSEPWGLVTKLAKKAVDHGLELGAEELLRRYANAGRLQAFLARAGVAFVETGEAVLSVTWSHLDLLATAISEGRELRDAADRDAMNLAIVFIARADLDPMYVAAAEARLGVSRHGAVRIVERLMSGRGPAAWEVIRGAAERSAREGTGAVQSRGLRTQEGFEHALALSPELFDRYWSDAAFRHGVDSALFVASHQGSR